MAQTVPFSIIKTISGRYGGIVYVTRGGKTHTRPYAAPRNPRTRAQQQRRMLFAQAVRSWRGLDAAQKALWNRRARHRPTSGYHLYLGTMLRGEAPPVRVAAPSPRRYSSVSTPPPVRSCSHPAPVPPPWCAVRPPGRTKAA